MSLSESPADPFGEIADQFMKDIRKEIKALGFNNIEILRDNIIINVYIHCDSIFFTIPVAFNPPEGRHGT